MNCVVDISLPKIGVGRKKTLMRRKAAQIEPVDERPPLKPLQIALVLILHLAMQQLHAIEAHLARQIDALLDVAILAAIELPERVRADADAIASRSWFSG